VDVHAQGPNEKGPPALGRITFVDNGVDQTTGTIRVKGSFPNLDRRFWPGQYLNVTVRLATDPTALVVDGQLRLVPGSRVSIKPAAERQAP
jgi:multidrug efflux system membrane fusion protein